MPGPFRPGIFIAHDYSVVGRRLLFVLASQWLAGEFGNPPIPPHICSPFCSI